MAYLLLAHGEAIR